MPTVELTPRTEKQPGVPRMARSKSGVAASLGVSTDFVEEHIWSELKLIRRGRLVFVAVTELQRWLDTEGRRTLPTTVFRELGKRQNGPKAYLPSFAGAMRLRTPASNLVPAGRQPKGKDPSGQRLSRRLGVGALNVYAWWTPDAEAAPDLWFVHA
jgi:hypothetical protein